MLARTADNLYWLGRYMERADFLARMIEVTQRLEALPTAYASHRTEWESALASAGGLDRYYATYKEFDQASAIEFLVFDADNPSSIRTCIELARTNARAVRTALTVEMWQAINSGWLELKRFDEIRRSGGPRSNDEDLAQFLDVVKKTATDFDGAAYRTMLRNDMFWFSRLGLYLERADNTARILDVKYHVLLPEAESVGGSLDYFQWTALLRSVSALTAYHWVYRESVKPWLVADLLIRRPEMPRSLISCYVNIVDFLGAIATAYGRQGASQRLARQSLARLENAEMKDIFKAGLHEFITSFLDDNRKLGVAISEQYLLA